MPNFYTVHSEHKIGRNVIDTLSYNLSVNSEIDLPGEDAHGALHRVGHVREQAVEVAHQSSSLGLTLHRPFLYFLSHKPTDNSRGGGYDKLFDK